MTVRGSETCMAGLAKAFRVLACSSLIPGCTAQTDGDDEVAVGDTEQAATLSQKLFEVTWFGGSHDRDTGSSATQTCFVTGVRGALSGQTLSPYTPIAEVGVRLHPP